MPILSNEGPAILVRFIENHHLTSRVVGDEMCEPLCPCKIITFRSSFPQYLMGKSKFSQIIVKSSGRDWLVVIQSKPFTNLIQEQCWGFAN